MEIIRKRNATLNQQLEDLKQKLDFDKQLNMDGYKHAKELIADLERIKENWNKNLLELEKHKIEYAFLIAELKKVKSTMASVGFKIPLYKKIWNKLIRHNK